MSKFKLYQSDGLTLQYEFPLVQYCNAPQSSKSLLEIKGQRAKGSLIIDGGDESWVVTIRGVMAIDQASQGYNDLMAKIADLEDKILLNTPYVLKINKTDVTYYEYNVKRVEKIEYGETLRNYYVPYSINLTVNSW